MQSTIEPGRTARVSAEYRVADNPPNVEGLPSHIRVTADIGADPVFGGERECNEDNNTAEIEVRDPGDLPDLRVDTVEAFPQVCQCIDMTVTFTNIGTAPAENPTVQFLGGDPEQGGFELARSGYAGIIEPGEQVEVTTQTCKLAVGQTVRIYAVVDYTEQIVECDESNNIGRTDRAVQCLLPRE